MKKTFLIALVMLTGLHCSFALQDDPQKYLDQYLATGSAESAARIHELAPGSKFDLFCQMWELRKIDPAGALEKSRILIDRFPDFPEAKLAMGYLQISEEQDYQKAITYLDKAIELRKDLGMAYVYRGLARMYLEDYQPAIEDFNAVLAMDKNNAAANMLRGVARFETGDASSIVSDFEIAVQKDHEIITEYYFADIKDALDKAVELAPDNANLLFARGYAVFSQGLWKSAGEDFEKAIQLISENAEYYKYAGACNYYLKNEEAAESELKKALGINPDDPETYYYLGLVANYLKNLPQQGYEYMTNALRLDDSQAEYYYQRAKSSYELTDYVKGMEDVQKALNMYQGNGNFYALRGMLRLKLKYEDDQICEDFNKAYELGTFYRIRKEYKRHCK